MGNVQNLQPIEGRDLSLEVFGINDLKILELKKTYSKLVISDTKSFDATKAARTHIVSVRTSIEKARKTADAPLRESLKSNKDEADRLTGLVMEVEQPLQDTVRAWELEKENEKAEKIRVERERVECHEKILKTVSDLGALPYGATIETIKVRIESLGNIVIDDSLEEFEQRVSDAYSAADFMLASALDGATTQEKVMSEQRLKKERLAKQREELEARQKEIDLENKDRELKIEAQHQELQKQQDAIDAEKQKAINEQNDKAEKLERERVEKANEIARASRIAAEQERVEAMKPDDEKLKIYFIGILEFAETSVPEFEHDSHTQEVEEFLVGLRTRR